MLVFGKFGVLCFLEVPILRFALFPYYGRHNLPCTFETSLIRAPLACPAHRRYEISGNTVITCRQRGVREKMVSPVSDYNIKLNILTV